MLRLRSLGLVVFFSLLAAASPAIGQGIQTATISGTVQSADGQALPGVTVTVTSPSLQGERTAVSDNNGIYQLRGLAPGAYRVTFVIPGFRAEVRDNVEARTGAAAVVDVRLMVAVSETLVVIAPAPSPIATAATTQAFQKTVVDALPVGRRPIDVAEMSAGVTTGVFNAAQLTFGGSFGFDNVFMVNGVDVNDNIQGTFNTLFIEDAIEETAVLTHGISAEYGRFSGGVINVITRSGGNAFSGSVREGFGNPAWVQETPLQRQSGVENASALSTTHEGTFGGPVLRGRVWFFAAGRRERANTANTFAQGGAGYRRTDTNTRGEGKVTATIAPAQTLQASYIDNATRQVNMSAIAATSLLDARTLVTRELPNRLFSASYNGTTGRGIFTTLQYSQKVQRFLGNGGTATDLVDSPFRTLGATPGVPGGLVYNAPYLDASTRVNRQSRRGEPPVLQEDRRCGDVHARATRGTEVPHLCHSRNEARNR